MMLNKKITAVCFGCMAAFSYSAAFDLVRDNTAAVIILPENAPPSSKLAAHELSVYTEKITGSKPAVTAGSTQYANRVIIGTPASAGNLPPELVNKLNAMKSQEAYCIMAKGNTLYIIGKNDTAELYATYRFMEDKLGIRWLKTANKYDSGEYVPRRKNIVISDYAEYREPFFFKRALDQCGSNGNVVPVNSVEWANRNGFQTPVPYSQSYKYNPRTGYEKLRTQYYAPRIPRYAQQLGGSHITFTAPFRPTAKTFAEHPEYFALVDGNRVMGDQICIGNPEVQKKVADFITGKIKANGGTGEFTFGMVDRPTGWCECDKCRKLDGNDPKANFNEVSTRFFNAVNSISAMVFSVCPQADLRTWAYAAYRRVPHGIKLDSRLKVQFATHGRCWGHNLDDPQCKTNTEIYEKLREWRKFHAGVLYTYEYFFCSQGYYNCIEKVLAHDLKLYKEMKVTGWKEQAYFEDSDLLKFKEVRPHLFPSNWQMLHMTGKMLWDPSLDPDKLIEEAESLYYGKAYPAMKKYHDLRRKLWNDSNICIGYPRDNVRRTQTLLNIPGSKQALLNHLAEAKKLSDGDKTLLFRIGEDEKWLKIFWIEPNDKLNSAAGKPYCSPKFTGKIKIDGDGGDKAWSNAFFTKNFIRILDKDGKNGKIPKELETTAGILSDRDNLYFLITAMEPAADKLTMADGRVYRKDSIELFLYPPTAENVYYHLAVNPAGALFDAMQPGTREEFDSGTEVKAKILKDRYVIEMRIPAHKLARFVPGDIWKVHIGRNRAVKDSFTGDPKQNGFFALDGVTYHNYTAYHPLIIGPMPEPEFRNGDFSQTARNPVRAKLHSRKGKSIINEMCPSYWQLIGKNDVLEMCLHPDSEKDYYARLTAGILFQIHYGKGQAYKVSFRGRGEGKMNFDAFFYNRGSDRSKIKYAARKNIAGNITFGKEWRTYEFRIIKPEAGQALGLAFICKSGDICIDDVTVTRESELQYHGTQKQK